jgi:hypothetical protein
MPGDLENLLARKSSILAELAQLTAASPGGKPTYSIDGQMVDHAGYRKSLYDELAILDRLIAAARGPIEQVGKAVT